MRTPPSRWLSGTARLLRGLILAALALEAIYVVLINVFLSTPIFDKIVNAKPMDVDIHYARGWSLFPTRVHARQLSIRGTDSHLEWILRLDDVEFECSLFALLRREFHVTSVHGSGIRFRARLKVPSPAYTDAYVRDVPTIASLGAPRFLPDEPPNEAEKWDDRHWHLWTVRIDQAVAEHVHEVWIQDARFAGDAGIDGGFYLKPIRAVEVGPMTLAVREGSVSLASRVALDELSARGRLALGHFDPRVTSGAALLDRVSLSLDASGAIPNAGDLGVEIAPNYQLLGRVALPRVALRFEGGRIRDGSRVDASSTKLAVVGPTLEASGRVALTAEVARDQLVAHATIAQLETTFACTAPLLTLSLDSKELGVHAPLGDLHAIVDLPTVHVEDATQLMRELPLESKVQLLGGSLEGTAHAEVWRKEQRVRGSVEVRARALDAAVGPLHFRGDASVAASVGALQMDALAATDATATLDVSDGSLARNARPREPFVRVHGLRVDAVAEHVALDDSGQSFHLTLAIPKAELLDRDSIRAALGLGHDLRLGARQTMFSTTGELRVDGVHANARLQLELPALDVEYASRHLGLALTASVSAHTDDWHEDGVALDGARVVATRLALGGLGSPPAVTGSSIIATATSNNFRVRAPLLDLRVTAAAEGVRVEDASALAELLPHGAGVLLSTREGTLSARLAGEATNGVVRGTASVDAEGLGLMSPKVHASGSVRASAAIAKWNLKDGLLSGTARLELANIQGAFDPQARAPDFIARGISVSASAEDFQLARPSLRDVGYAVRVSGAELVDARALNVFLPSSEILAIDSGRASVSLQVAAQRGDSGAHGHAEAKLSNAGLILGDTHFAGDFTLVVRAADRRGDGLAIDLEGSQLAMRNVRVRGTSTNTSGWAGDLTVESGQLRLSPAPRLEGELVLRARDANPILGLLFRDTLPRLVASWTHMPSFTALTHVVVEPKELVVSDLLASGGDLSVRGTYVLRGARRSGGAFVVQKGPWSAGVDVDRSGAHLRLFGLDGWYRQRVASITGAN